MTFKHVKFADSPTMRALEKVAYDKGWVKPEPLVRTASPKSPNLAPTDNLMTNILKLCAGLRGTQGMEKYADELETCYLNYKRAQTMYDAHGEKGEDVIHSAHPKGSHKLEGVDSSEAVFEDILDRHVKMLQVVEKKPTGKLSEASQIIGAVRVVLGQNHSEEEYTTAIQNAMNAINLDLEKIKRLTDEELTVGISGSQYDLYIPKLTENPTIDNLKNLQDILGRLHTRLDPSSWVHYLSGGKTGLTEDTWQGIQDILNNMNTSVKNALLWRTQLKRLQSAKALTTDELAPTSSVSGERGYTSFSKTTPSATPGGGASELSILYNEITQSIGAAKAKAQGLPNEAALTAWFDKAQQYAKTAFEAGFSQATKNPTAAQQFIAKLTDIKAKVDRAQQKL